jgi:hypothetical protein
VDISPYWKEEEGISILSDGCLGFVFDSKYLKKEPIDENVRSYQVINNEFVDSSITAVKTDIRLEYAGNSLKTFFWPSYVRDRMKRIYDHAFEKAMHLKEQIADAPELLSAMQLSQIVATKKYFLYVAARKNSIYDLKGKMDFSYARCRKRESILINTDNIVMDMSICYNMGFWPVALPAKVFNKQARFLSLPLGADPSLLSRMGLFAGNIENA